MIRPFAVYAFPTVLALILSGCLVTTQEAIKKTAQSKSDVSGIASNSESGKRQPGRKMLETADKNIATPKKRTKFKRDESKSEEQEVKIMAKDLARTYPNVKKVMICYDLREDEWWITLYEDQGYYCELRQYVWSFAENDLNKFLRVERVSKKRLDRHLAKKERGKTCQVLEIEARPLNEPGLEATGKPQAGTKTQKEIKPSPKRQRPPRAVSSPSETVAGTSKPRTCTEKSRKQTLRADLRPPAVKPPSEKTKQHAESRRNSGATPSRSERTLISKKKSSELGAMKQRPRSRQQSRRLTTHSDRDTAPDEGNRPIERGRSPTVPTFHVFVYGSEMKHPDLLAWLEAKGYDSSLILDAKPAKLEGYDYVWNYYSPSRKGGAVNLEPKRGSTVLGLLIECEDSLLKAFDEKEGHPSFYTRSEKRVPVQPVKGGATVFAWLYLAKPNKGRRRDVWPTETYKEVVIDGAQFWRFPEQYMEKLKKWRTR